jgi:hypothetical protein
MSDNPGEKSKDKSKDKAEDNNSINFRNAAINKIQSLQAALNKEKSKRKNKSTSADAPTRLRGMRSFGENTKASRKT